MALAVVGVAILLYLMLRGGEDPKPPEPAPTPSAVVSVAPTPEPTPVPTGPLPNQVLRAKRTLRPGEVSIVSTSEIQIFNMEDKDFIPEGAIQTYDEISDKVLISEIYEGEIFVQSRFITQGKVVEQKLRNYVPKDMRAISLQVDAVSGTTGFISQGDIVDVVALYQASGKRFARIIIQNVLVMAKGNEYRPRRAKDAKNVFAGSEAGETFTLLVTPKMAVRMAHLIDRRGSNQFRLLLKNPDDKEIINTRGVLLSEILSGVSRPPMDEDMDTGEGIEILRGVAVDRSINDDQGGLIEGGQGFQENQFGAGELLESGEAEAPGASGASSSVVNPEDLYN